MVLGLENRLITSSLTMEINNHFFLFLIIEKQVAIISFFMHFHVIKLVNHFQLLIKLNRISHPNLHIKVLFLVSCPTILPKTLAFCYNGHMNEKVFRDPVHNYIHVNNQIIYDLINTKEFQRLRRIKQLGTSSYTFHGGEHSRFSHCLGVYEIARRITEIFEEKYPEEWNPAESLLTMTAALLHDLGHGAYSHTFEHLFDTDHEAITQEIIQSPETEIHQVLLQVAPDFPEKVASVIDHTYPNKQVVQLISSQIDADRMDYLLRDSYFTGASYENLT